MSKVFSRDFLLDVYKDCEEEAELITTEFAEVTKFGDVYFHMIFKDDDNYYRCLYNYQPEFNEEGFLFGMKEIKCQEVKFVKEKTVPVFESLEGGETDDIPFELYIKPSKTF